MPVEDHPVHDSTRRVGKRPGCWDRPPLTPGFWAQDGWETREQFIPLPDSGMTILIAQPKMAWIPHVQSTDCKSDYQECIGCTNYQGEKNGSNT
jgi:hypothetical protein